MGLIRILAIIVLIYFVLKFIQRYVFPILLRGLVKKVSETYSGQAEQPHKNKKEGEIIVKERPKSNKIIPKDKGEYINYEEVE